MSMELMILGPADGALSGVHEIVREFDVLRRG